MPFYHIGQQSLQWLQNYVKGATALAGAGFMKVAMRCWGTRWREVRQHMSDSFLISVSAFGEALAQSAEQGAFNSEVVGSTPTGLTKRRDFRGD